MNPPGFVYVIEAMDSRHVKVGFSKKPRERLRELQVGSASPLRLVGSRQGDQSLERQMHRALVAHRVQGEWFACDASTALQLLHSERMKTVSQRRDLALSLIEQTKSDVESAVGLLDKSMATRINANLTMVSDLITGKYDETERVEAT